MGALLFQFLFQFPLFPQVDWDTRCLILVCFASCLHRMYLFTYVFCNKSFLFFFL
ncbi:unnamed protein product [Brassica napus]|uniref:(rape) hypothetical protein n=1 Tax=Brassica napus TaxID=3708 RepID=A0A816I9M2_BRANA|nr:unnamed protein product [Brassica napus]